MSKTDADLSKANRILVALDASARGQAALAAALQIALHTSAELEGLFVEDEDLVRLASLPFAREVDLASASPRELHLAHMESALRASAQQAQQAFASALQQVNLQWTFRVVRGTVTQASLAAAGDVDLIVIGQRGRSPRIMASGYLPQRTESDKRVVAVFDGSPSAFRALELGNSLAEPGKPVLSVLVLAEKGDEVAHRCMSWLQQHGMRAEVDQVLKPTKDAIIDFVRKWPPRLLVINRDSEFVGDAEIGRLVNEFDCPLVLC